MFFNSIRQTNRLLKEINRLLRKINSLLSKGMSNIYEKVTTERKWPTQNFDFFFFFSTHADITEFSNFLLQVKN